MKWSDSGVHVRLLAGFGTPHNAPMLFFGLRMSHNRIVLSLLRIEREKRS